MSKSRKPLLNEPGVHPTAASRTAVTLRTCSSTDHPYQRNPCEESEAGHGDSIEEAPAGSGIWAVQLAKRGWQVTGVDLVEKALQRASDRGESAGVDGTLVHGDVTALRASDVGSGFRLVLDAGTFQRPERRPARGDGQGDRRGRGSGRHVLMIAWPKRRRPLIRGVSRGEIESAFPGWTLTDMGASHFKAPKPIELLLRPDEHWYRLRRE